MIDRMTKYSFVLLSSRTEEFLKELQELGLVDITRSSRPVDDRSVELLSQIENAKVEIKDIKEGSDAHLRELRTALAAQLRDYEDIKVWGSWDREKLAELGRAEHREPESPDEREKRRDEPEDQPAAQLAFRDLLSPGREKRHQEIEPASSRRSSGSSSPSGWSRKKRNTCTWCSWAIPGTSRSRSLTRRP